MVRLLSDLLQPGGANAPTLSLSDFGAGVGQMCSALAALDGRHRCSSYDGAGNVEEITGGYVRWVDLTRPLHLGRSDWVVSFEVGEHVPNPMEPMFIRNLHAHNCRGIVLSWGSKTRGKSGQDDSNYHPISHLVGLFSSLGYSLRNNSAQWYLRDRGLAQGGRSTWPHHFWFDHNLVGIFDRVTPLRGDGCTVLDAPSSSTR